jgi:hypothetical protein
MSWSFEFVAENKAAARAELEKVFAPDVVKEFLTLALDGLKDDGLIQVASTGHLATTDSFQVTTNNTTVKRIHVTTTSMK